MYVLLAKMKRCENDKERYNACKDQIKFRREVLYRFMAGDKKFNFTEGGKSKQWTALKDHLFSFRDAATSVAEGESVQTTICNDASVTIPLLIGKTVIHYFKSDNGSREAYTGNVLSQVPGFSHWFNIK